MAKIASMLDSFTEVAGEQPEWIARHGWPVDLVPARNTEHGENGAGPGEIRVQPYITCCANNLWLPMQKHVQATKPTLIITGQRRDEFMRNRLRDEYLQTIEGVDYLQPLNEWNSAQVVDYIASQNWELPPFYDLGFESSSDCWSCTAYLDHNQTRLKHLKQHYPIKWGFIAPALEATHRAAAIGLSQLESVLYCTQS